MANPPPNQICGRSRSRLTILARSAALAVTFITGALAAAPANFQSGSVSITQTNSTTWTTVNFTRTFATAPVVVMGPATKANGDPLVMRVRNVTATSFQYQVDEWDYLTGDHAAETVHYLALSEGTHVFGTQRWQVGRVAAVNRTASSVTLTGFTAAPVVLAQVESTANTIAANNPRALKTRIASVTSTSFQVNLETQESYTTAISNESIGYMAVSAGTGYLDGKVLSAVTTSAATTDAFGTITFPASRTNPIFIAQAQTKNDTNPGELRMQSLSATSVQVQFQEETSSSADVTHTAEAVGYVVLGDMNGEVAAKVEVGDLNVTQASATTWTKVNLANAYTTPVVVMGPLSYTNSTSLTIRVRNVLAVDAANANKGSFEFIVDRWDHHSGQTHNYLEHLSYIVAESGTHAVGGVVWQAGRTSSVTQSTSTQSLSTSFPNAPAVFAQVATTNDADACQARVSAVTPTSFGIEIDESEIDADAHAGETVHWIAMTQGSSNFFTTGMRFQAGQITNNDSAFRKVTFSRAHADPFIFASMQTKNDADPATIRWQYLFADRVNIVAQEDNHPLQFGEGSVNNTHSSETTAFLVVQGAADVDEDGAPDSWETATVGNLTTINGAADDDGDALTNQQEFHNRIDFATSSNYTVFTGGTVTVGNAVTNAYEVNDRTATTIASTSARYRFTRTGAFAPLTINFTVAGTASTDTNRAPASTSDYTLWTANTGGTQLTTSINLPVEAQSVDVYVRPTVTAGSPDGDGLEEYPEGLRITLGANGSTYTVGGTTTSVVIIYDAQNIPANERLFVGPFLPQGAAVTSAYGYGTIILNGTHNAARISTTFNGLTTPQTDIDGSHVHYANSGSASPIAHGTIIYGDPDGLPNGPLVDYPWTIVDSAGVKGQQIIDAIYRNVTGVNLYVNVHTNRYASGEIRADLTLQTGSPTPPPVPSSPTLEDLATDEEVRRECARFLTQATFGPTEAEITALYNTIATPKTTAANRIAAFSAWIDTQFGSTRDQTTLYDYNYAADQQEWALIGAQPLLDSGGTPVGFPPNNAAAWQKWSSTVGTPPIPAGRNKESYDPDNKNRRHAWWMIANDAHDQLRQRVGFALEQIYVVSDREGTIGARAYGHSRYYDMLTDFADGIRHLQPPGSPGATPPIVTSYSSANGSNITIRQLLEDVSKHPIMGKYLSHLKNQKAQGVDTNANGILDPEEITLSPDENYAREIMQLFSIGLLELWDDGTLKLQNNGQPIATYDNDDIKELSKVFTGYSFALVQNSSANNYVPAIAQNSFGNASEGAEYFHPGYENPMKNFVAFHDEGVKNFLSANLPAYVDATPTTAEREAYAETELDTTMDALYNHDNIAPFLSSRLIQRLTTSNPSRGYIYRVTQAFKDSNGATAGGLRGSLPAVVKAILLDYEARTMKNVDPQTINGNTSVSVGYGKVKEPILRYVQVLRAFGARSQIDMDEASPNTNDLVGYGYLATQADNFPGGATQLRYGGTGGVLGQTPNNAPSVFNWYLPDYTPGGRVAAAGLVAPELQILTENMVVQNINYHRTVDYSSIIDPAAALPGGQGVTNLIGDTTNAQDGVFFDLSGIVTDYITNRETVGSTEVSACTYLVDRLDALLCSGSLKAKYGAAYTATAVDPRSVIINQLATIAPDAPPVSKTNGGNRVRAAVYLITSSPEFIVQK
jgi:uncharacterized protein (DUF1800 family)